MEQFDYIVVGAGAMGGATAYHLAKDNHRVLLLEQFEIGHARGSSHGESRIFRFAYAEANYSRFAMQSKPLWRELEADAGEQLLLDTGGLDFADDPSGFDDVRQVERTLEGLGARCEPLNRSQLAQRFPQWRIGDDGIGLYSPDAGVLFASKCVSAAVRTAGKHGATVRENERVESIAVDGSAVRVTTAKGVYQAKRVVLTAGSWLNDLIGGVNLRLPLRIEKEQVAYFDAGGSAAHRPGRMPIFIHWRAESVYGFPDLGNGVKTGFHHAGNYIDHPDQHDFQPSQRDLSRMSRYISEHMPGLAPAPLAPVTCLYTNTPDEDFIIDALPSAPNVIIGSPCSGHGFKFAIGVGRALADLAVDGETAMSISHVRKLRDGVYN